MPNIYAMFMFTTEQILYPKSENFENITFSPIIYKSVSKNLKTLNES